MSMKVKLEANFDKALSDLKHKEELTLKAIGMKWQGIVKKIITNKGIVDTGHLRATAHYETDDKSLKVGWLESVTPYALWNEMYNKKGDFLRPSVLDYKETYKSLAESILK